MSRVHDALRSAEIEITGEFDTSKMRGSMLSGVVGNGPYTGDPHLVNMDGGSVTKIAGESLEMGREAEVVVHTEPQSVLADRLRFLRAHLRHLWNAGKLKSLLITSPFPHD